MQRAAVAVPSNIAEGSRRNHTLEFVQFLGIANASAAELETQVLISVRHYKEFDHLKIESLLSDIQKMLPGLIHALKVKHYSLSTNHKLYEL